MCQILIYQILIIYHGRVSLRECFLYFIELACAESHEENPMKVDAWVSDNLTFQEDDLISDHASDSSSSSSEESDHRPSKPSSRREAKRPAQESAAMAALESRTGQLTIEDQSHRDLPWHKSTRPVTVYFSNTQRQWYYQDSRRGRVYVELHEEKASRGQVRFYFVQGGYRYLAKKQ